MKTTVNFLSLAALANAQWWAGAPDCAHDCFSSWYSSSSAWPAPTHYCTASQGASVSSCLQSACSATPTAVTSYSSLSASLCAQWSSCSAAGSTGVYTISAPAFTGNWPGPSNSRGGGPGGGGRHNDDQNWSQQAHTWSGGAYTLTGCEWSGNVWAGGPGGCAPSGSGGAGGCSPWGPWGKGWSTLSTVTQTVTRVVTLTGQGGSATGVSTSVGLGAVVLAASGDVTSTSVVAATAEEATTTGGPAAATGTGATGTGGGGASATGNAAVAGKDGVLGLKVMGAVLGGVVAVAALL
ncbi:hypothetical protein C8A00DRAFT_32361 [Chaetomidium leptoderma]|uniref:Extracellular membrane protein CFEM domain-containing protein n=1 Tax=Chaetomidium leptoderma TaxID=669021 RepID=A0AAN6VP64_9PEZI|nr:hypothetical protein C8A00DRAFT_32361 [Chaetomidium leptoderma]